MSLLAWFPLNGNLNNLGLSDVTLTNSNATVATGKQFNNGYEFNGTSSCLYTSKTSKELFADENSFTLAIMAYCTAYPTTQTGLLCSNQYQSSGCGIGLKTDGTICLQLDNSSSSTDGSTGVKLPLNKWTHIAYTYYHSTKTLSLYIDGVLSNTRTVSFDWIPGGYKFYIGRNTQGGWKGYYTGILKDARIYNHCLSVIEINEIKKQCFLYYNFEDGLYDNENIVDSSGFSNNGKFLAINNGVDSTTSESITPTYFTNSTMVGDLSINFGYKYPYKNSIDTGLKVEDWGFDKCDRSLEVWIYPTAAGPILGTTALSWMLNKNSTTSIQFVQWDAGGGHTNTMSMSTNAANNAWSHIVVTWNSDTLSFYVNGELKTTKQGTNSDKGNKAVAGNLMIGGNIYKFGSNTMCMSGYMSLVKLYDTCLSATDVADMYKSKGYVSSTGDLFAYKFTETANSTSNLINITGISEANEFTNPTSGTEYMEVYSTKIQANNIYEL